MSDSRIEALLEALLNGTDPPGEPQSRVEAYLYALCLQGIGTGGSESGGGTSGNSITLFDTNDMSKRYKLTITNGKLTMTEVV